MLSKILKNHINPLLRPLCLPYRAITLSRQFSSQQDPSSSDQDSQKFPDSENSKKRKKRDRPTDLDPAEQLKIQQEQRKTQREMIERELDRQTYTLNESTRSLRMFARTRSSSIFWAFSSCFIISGLFYMIGERYIDPLTQNIGFCFANKKVKF